MKKLREMQVSMRMALTMCAAAGAVTAVLCLLATGWSSHAIGSKLHEIDRLVSDKYIGELDEDSVADYAATGYIAGLGDKWSSYIPAESYEAYRLSGEGKGCGIGVSVTSTDTSIRVTLVYDDSPAAKAGIEKGDYILGTGGLTVEKDGSSAVISAISGEEGTDVTVTVQKADGTTKDLTMQRALVTQKMAWGKMLNDRVGYIRIENFHSGCAEQFKAALQSLTDSGAQSLVIDVRHNGGGRVKEMSEALDPLLGEGTIMTLRMKDGAETVYSSDADCIDLPIAVLIDDQSISAAEFFAAALQEYGRAALVGTHTTGKGRAQRTYELSDGSAVNLSVEEYFTPKGKSLADVGIAPDAEVKLTDEQTRDFFFLTPETDSQLQKAMEIVQ
ncbi:S41 family peptidase [uncultured Agathobaculum sp.]|uniref:S41 family peptidase n=1 Tax=uncultured Agathobaculum sp. TaxID=2048140 RepID=UPI00296E60D5